MKTFTIDLINNKTSTKGPKTHLGRVPVYMANTIKNMAAKNRMSICQLTEIAIGQFINQQRPTKKQNKP